MYNVFKKKIVHPLESIDEESDEIIREFTKDVCSQLPMNQELPDRPFKNTLLMERILMDKLGWKEPIEVN